MDLFSCNESPVAGAPFLTTLFPSIAISMNRLGCSIL